MALKINIDEYECFHIMKGKKPASDLMLGLEISSNIWRQIKLTKVQQNKFIKDLKKNKQFLETDEEKGDHFINLKYVSAILEEEKNTFFKVYLKNHGVLLLTLKEEKNGFFFPMNYMYEVLADYKPVFYTVADPKVKFLAKNILLCKNEFKITGDVTDNELPITVLTKYDFKIHPNLLIEMKQDVILEHL